MLSVACVFWMLSNRCCRHHRRPIVVLSMCLRNLCVCVHEWSGRLIWENRIHMIIWYQAINTVFNVHAHMFTLSSVLVLWTRFGQTNRPPERCTNYTVKLIRWDARVVRIHALAYYSTTWFTYAIVKMCDMCTLRTLYSYTNMLGTLINIVEAWTHSLSTTEQKEFACDRKRDWQRICSCIFETHTYQ